MRPVRASRSKRDVRHARSRKRLRGTADRPRLSEFRSLRQISAQIIDDETGATIAAASSFEKSVTNGGNKTGAAAVGELIAIRAKDKGIKKVVFDRAGYRYTGRVSSLADAARKNGLEF